MNNEEHIAKLAEKAAKLDVAAMTTLNTLMLNSDSDKVRLEAAEKWMEHRRALEIAAIRQSTPTERQAMVQINIGDEQNVKAIRERILSNNVPAQLPPAGDA